MKPTPLHAYRRTLRQLALVAACFAAGYTLLVLTLPDGALPYPLHFTSRAVETARFDLLVYSALPGGTARPLLVWPHMGAVLDTLRTGPAFLLALVLCWLLASRAVRPTPARDHTAAQGAPRTPPQNGHRHPPQP